MLILRAATCINELTHQREACYAALANGGTDDRSPTARGAYYGAYVRDPDSNKIHFAWRTEDYCGMPPDRSEPPEPTVV